ncbi:rab GTPase-binding effector protein 1 isoform X2 [Anopheles aquasalis]|uniref:rab GTPase-binding effector protein 1 isoform X2 n=1 Tax=Anopheles aquasalis TaxID=42839 RepID=UPI00215B36B5|nr:rab GTPase-binding effector protein 1 isoform X2 [Anopheles aquasalis]
MENKGSIAGENESSTVTKIEAEDEATKLQAELSRVREEFNQQRARMKELYLAKENECKRVVEDLGSARKELNELKAQIRIMEFSREKDAEEQRNRMEDENRTLKQLVNETLDESSVMRDTVRQLQEKNKSMLAEIAQLKEGLAESNQVSPSLAKTVQQAKKIILKFGTVDSNSADNLEDSMRKAQEDAEVLRSLVVPLEEEIKSLKEKLRIAYETRETSTPGADASTKQQKSALLGMLKPEEENSGAKDLESSIDDSHPTSKDSCIRCEALETSIEEQLKEERERSATVEKQVERLKEQLTKEAALRTDLEAQWHKKREEHKIEVQKLTDRAMKTELVLDKLRQDYTQLKLVLRDELQKLTEERERVYYQINNLQQDNDFLAGKYVASSEALKDQALNFPQTVDALQEYVLRLHEKLIVTQTGCEFAERKARSMQDEVTLLQEQQCLRDRDAKKAEQEYTQTCMQLQERLRRLQNEFQQFVVIREELEVSVSDHEKQNSELRMQIIELQAGNERLDKQVCDLKSKMAVLQEDLANNEAVQKDFVKLSQSLQMQLEKIRSADTQVRWQDDDDVDQCPNCKKEFTVTRRKQHCRHCGTIYCQPCLSKSVVSGPNRRPARVCDVCHTLLVQDTAPYFSREPPQSP